VRCSVLMSNRTNCHRHRAARPVGHGVPVPGSWGCLAIECAHHPGLRPACGVSRSERETPFGGSAGRLTILTLQCCASHRSARSFVTARRGFPAPLRSGWWGCAPTKYRPLGRAKNAGAFFTWRRPQPKIGPLGRPYFGDCGKTRVPWLQTVRFA